MIDLRPDRHGRFFGVIICFVLWYLYMISNIGDGISGLSGIGKFTFGLFGLFIIFSMGLTCLRIGKVSELITKLDINVATVEHKVADLLHQNPNTLQVGLPVAQVATAIPVATQVATPVATADPVVPLGY